MRTLRSGSRQQLRAWSLNFVPEGKNTWTWSCSTTQKKERQILICCKFLTPEQSKQAMHHSMTSVSDTIGWIQFKEKRLKWLATRKESWFVFKDHQGLESRWFSQPTLCHFSKKESRLLCWLRPEKLYTISKLWLRKLSREGIFQFIGMVSSKYMFRASTAKFQHSWIHGLLQIGWKRRRQPRKGKSSWWANRKSVHQWCD